MGRNQIPEYVVWKQVIQRCTNEKHPSFKYYGGRGITICTRWRDSYDAFIADVGPRPSPKHTLDRERNEKGYEPGNCRWITRTEQARNRRDNRLLTYAGETKTLAEWAAEAPPTMYEAVRSRLYKGWTLPAAMNTPVKQTRRWHHARTLATSGSTTPGPKP